MAAGLSIERERIGELRRSINDYVQAHVATEDQVETVEIDAILTLKAASRTFFDRLDLLAPYGQGNPEPLLAFAGVRVGFAQVMKGGHVRCELVDGSGHKLKGIAWRAEETAIGDAMLRPCRPGARAGTAKGRRLYGAPRGPAGNRGHRFVVS